MEEDVRLKIIRYVANEKFMGKIHLCEFNALNDGRIELRVVFEGLKNEMV